MQNIDLNLLVQCSVKLYIIRTSNIDIDRLLKPCILLGCCSRGPTHVIGRHPSLNTLCFQFRRAEPRSVPATHGSVLTEVMVSITRRIIYWSILTIECRT
jgi:hypothetical protein